MKRFGSSSTFSIGTGGRVVGRFFLWGTFAFLASTCNIKSRMVTTVNHAESSIKSFHIYPNNPSIKSGSIVDFTAVTVLSTGEVVDVTNDVTWKSDSDLINFVPSLNVDGQKTKTKQVLAANANATGRLFATLNKIETSVDIKIIGLAKPLSPPSMFYAASVFNQNIGSWNTANVTAMNIMFSGATAFNQNLGAWNVTKVTAMTSMFQGDTLSTANYDALLIGWSAQVLKTSVTFHAGSSKYSAGAAATARSSIVSTYTWTISDGGQAP